MIKIENVEVIGWKSNVCDIQRTIVTLDITAPLYWWTEFDYEVNGITDSCSTIHQEFTKEFSLSDFSCEHLISDCIAHLTETISMLNQCREVYNNWNNIPKLGIDPQIKNKEDVRWQIIQLLPNSYNQKRTVVLNYWVLANTYKSFCGHKLDEWVEFCKCIKMLPGSEFITGEDKEE